jgi:glycosyltransferase involved in cell wall biosynthesis
MPRRTVLFVCHNHPSVRPGGAEAYAVELHKAFRESEEFRPILLAKSGPPLSGEKPHNRTLIAPVDEAGDQYFFFTPPVGFNDFYGTFRRKGICTRHFRDFLLAFRPDVVHFQHTLFLGYDFVREVRQTLPHAAIIYTLHEYLPICPHLGQMVRTQDRGLCLEASPRRCHECFPDISPQALFLRKRYIQSHFAFVDLFLAPSQFLLERYVDWGIPRDRIRYEEYGRLEMPAPAEVDQERPRTRLGFFGQLSPFKGADVLLRAMSILHQEEQAVNSTSTHLWLHGANLDLQPEAFQKKFTVLLETIPNNVTLMGRYEHRDLPRLMANIDWVVVPSIWWENSPLVIQEAFQFKRPVLCSDIGGMAEKVAHERNGLHFRVGDPHDLASVIRRATQTPGWWHQLRAGIPTIYPIQEHLTVLTNLYHSLLERSLKPV